MASICPSSSPSHSHFLPTPHRLRDQYLLNPQRTAQLLETFPLQAITKKVQPQGGGLRCAVHKRAAAMQAGGGAGGGHHHHGHGHRHHHHHHHHHHETWDWEDAWERLPGQMKERVAAIPVASLEAAMHHATATHRFCVDCKHNVVTALDLLAGRYRAEELENREEYNAELFKPFLGRVLLPPSGRERAARRRRDTPRRWRSPTATRATGTGTGTARSTATTATGRARARAGRRACWPWTP